MIVQVLVYKHLIFIVLIAALFYIFIPGAGAFEVRYKWRIFRKKVASAASFKVLNYRILRSGDSMGKEYKFFGTLQALEGEYGVWLTDGRVSVFVDLDKVPVFILPSASLLKEPIAEAGYPDEIPRRTKWHSIYSLPEGTRMFVSGHLEKRDGKVVFSSTEREKLLVVIHDCSNEAFYSQAIWTGRHGNEYWNPVTPGSLTIGSFLLFIYFYMLLKEPYMQVPAAVSLLFSLVPLMLFLPPGLLFYYFYRYLWKKARLLRVERDLVKLPLSFFPSGCMKNEDCSVHLSGGSSYVMKKIAPREVEKYSPPAVVRYPDLSRTIFPGDFRSNETYYLFYVESKDSRGLDPMAENVIIPGDPVLISRKSETKAFKLEFLAGVMIAGDFFLNGIILFAAISYLIR